MNATRRTEWIAKRHPNPPHIIQVETADRVVFHGLIGRMEDAQMAAAALELYAALEALTEWGCTHTNPRDPNSPHDLLLAARSALQKAKPTP